MASCEDAAVVAGVERMVARAREAAPAYAGPRAPVRADELSALLSRAACRVETFPFRSDAVAMTLPECAGVHLILLDRNAERADRTFALRHEVAHVLAGDVEGAVFLADGDSMDHAERAADLFALADLVPAWWIRELRRGRAAWSRVQAGIADAVSTYAERWPAGRLEDRAALRLLLFRRAGI